MALNMLCSYVIIFYYFTLIFYMSKGDRVCFVETSSGKSIFVIIRKREIDNLCQSIPIAFNDDNMKQVHKHVADIKQKE